MNLLDYNDTGIVISPEALVLEPFNKLWKSNKDKTKSVKEIAYVYFMVSKSNEFNFWQIANEVERSKEVILHVFGSKSKYSPSIYTIDALKFYKEKTVPYSSGLLGDAIIATDKARQYLRDVDWNLKDKSEKFIYDINKVKELILRLPDLDDAIQKLRTRIKQEEQSNGDAKRGKHKIGMYEGGENDI